MADARDILLERMRIDLMGPSAPDEVIADRPSDRYLTGALFPPGGAVPAERDEKDPEGRDSPDSDTALDGVRVAQSFRPSVAGLSFAIRPEAGASPRLTARVEGARYRPVAPAEEEDATQGELGEKKPRRPLWARIPHELDLSLKLDASKLTLDIWPQEQEEALKTLGLRLHARVAPWGSVFLITLALSNAASSVAKGRDASDAAAWFQVGLSVSCESGCRFVPKPTQSVLSGDEDLAALALLHRDQRQWAVGHVCSAMWDKGRDGAVTRIRTSWLPEAFVPVVSAAGGPEFRTEGASVALRALWLATAEPEDLSAGLLRFTEAYAAWIAGTEARLGELPEELQAQGGLHMARCRQAEARMRRSAALLKRDPEALAAFRMANAALGLQYSWRKDPDPPDLRWRPFQLGFALLCLESLADPASEDREVMDLLWFPTGGGKTEAYLLLTAFTIFLRRLRAKGAARGEGVAAFMRYTLRLLTIQQFERAAALICACELIRKGAAGAGAATPPEHFREDAPISLGLWVGNAATPNDVSEAEAALEAKGENSPAQLRNCPCCHEALEWGIAKGKTRTEVRCPTPGCLIAAEVGLLPVWTVDEELYRETPTLVIGTIDKYAQIVRKQEAGRLFGLGTAADPPDLIIQDELHLISGPLGSLAGLYEAAIDEFCRAKGGARAKTLGSTATIRRAADQIRALFDREAFQFPPPGLDQADSGFATEDRSLPGRRYVGVTTIGRSAKFVQQAAAASLLQGASDSRIDEASREGYWTLVDYFNSLRELGGALVLMRDDVTRSIEDYASRRSQEAPRSAENQIELTSRVGSGEIPRFLKDLERSRRDPDHVDVVLASTMISVGMDVPRLGLMLVNGQPKTIAEYIQATSRVGRDRRWPGLVVTIFNAAKPRDRSRFETFATWHGALYREVEATSVTPFAPRARDRALHAPYVALVRHLVAGMEEPGAIDRRQDEAEDLLERLVRRVERIDPDEAGAVRAQLEAFLDSWFDRAHLKHYWNDYGDALMVSAEVAAARGGRGFSKDQKPTPNSLRSVEASAAFALLDQPRETREEP